MNVLVKLAVILIVSIVGSQLKAQNGYNISVTIEGLDNNDGKVFCALYDSEGAFLSQPIKATKSEITDKQCKITFEDISDGTYAISVFHDENNNNKLDTAIFGIPTEDYGCSNDAKGFMGPPKWKDAKFQLTENKLITIKL